MTLHFVGIGGVGMSGIAEVFLNQGYSVSGSDLTESETTRRLSQQGAKISYGHRVQNVEGASVVVVSSAVKKDNPEILEAKRRRIPVIPRAEMLGELMRGKTGIAVAGSHGKTTTTSMLACILTHAGLDPTAVIGGKVDSLGGGAKLGQGKVVVVEADESDGSFLHLPATYAAVTNIDDDHLDHFGTVSAIEDAFVDFVGRLPFYGRAAVCGDDPGILRCMERWNKPIITYGVSSSCDIRADELTLNALGSRFSVVRGRERGSLSLVVPGKHNVLNALAATAIALELGVSLQVIAEALSEFRGVNRRFQIRWRDERRRMAIVDDYGHHPTEIAATLEAARGFWPEGRIITVFQPHRYSRTLHCKQGFLSAFHGTDLLYLTEIYAAGEEPIPGVSSASLAREISNGGRGPRSVEYVDDLETFEERLTDEFREGDLLLCLGAGSITKFAEKLSARYGKQT